MPYRIFRDLSDAYARSSHVYEHDRGRDYPYSSSRRDTVYDYSPSHQRERRHQSRERSNYMSTEDLARQRRSMSDRESYGRSSHGRDSYGRSGSTRTPERSDSSRQSRNHRSHVIDTSRPPVSSRSQRDQPELVRVSRPSRRDSVSSRRSLSISSPRSISRWFGGGSSTRAPSPDKSSKQKRRSKSESRGRSVSCVACLEDVPPSRSTDLPCGHRMCNSCLRRLFRMSVTDPVHHMPPRCCSQEHIPLRHVERLFDIDFITVWHRKFCEYTTHNRTYCPSRKCGRWIKPENMSRENGRKVARCNHCDTKVCCSCGGGYHSSPECPKDEDTANFLSQAADRGWKRCYRCKAMVELREGCNHMICRCGAQFCMSCGAKWKSCHCSWFNNYHEHEADGNHLGTDEPSLHPLMHNLEMQRRRLQELRNRVVATYMQGDEDYDMMGGVGTIHGIGNAAGHLMNESYRRDSGALSSRPRPTQDRAAGYASDVHRTHRYLPSFVERATSMRNRSERQPPAVVVPLRRPVTQDNLPPRRDAHVRRQSMDDGRYKQEPQRSIWERVIPMRTSRRHENEPPTHAPTARRHSSAGPPPRRSAMAGLNTKGRGMDRVAGWLNYVEKGVPDGESVAGHA